MNDGTIDAAGGDAEDVGDGAQCTFTGSGCDLTGATDIDDIERGGGGGSGSSGSNSGCFYAKLLAGDLTYPLSGGQPADYDNDCNIARNGDAGVILTTDTADPGALF